MYRSSGPVFRSRPQSAPHRRYFKAQSPKSPEPDEYRRIKTDHRVAFIRLPPDPASTRLSAAIRETVVPTSLIIRSKFHPVASRLQSFPNGRTARGPSLPATSSGAVPHTAIFRRREPSGPSCFLPRSSLRRASAPHTAKPRRHAQRISPRQSHIQRTAGKSGPPHPTIVARNSPTRHRRNASLRRKFGGPFECVRADTHHPGRIEPQHSAVRSRTTDRLTNRGQSIAVTGTGTFQKKRGHSVPPLLRTGPNTSTRSGKQCIHRPDTTSSFSIPPVSRTISTRPKGRNPSESDSFSAHPRDGHRHQDSDIATQPRSFRCRSSFHLRSTHPVSLRIQDRAPEIPLPLPLHKTAMTYSGTPTFPAPSSGFPAATFRTHSPYTHRSSRVRSSGSYRKAQRQQRKPARGKRIIAYPKIVILSET